MQRLTVAVFGDDSRNPPSEGLVQTVNAQQRLLYGETREGQQVAEGMIKRVGSMETLVNKIDSAVKDLQDRRQFWIQMGAAAVTLLGTIVNLLIALHNAGII